MPSRLINHLRSRLTRLDSYDLASLILFALMTLAAFWVIGDYAISNDEEVQHKYGEMILAYYASGFTDTRLFEFRNLYLYGGLFDIIAIGLGHVLPFDIYLIRHGLCAFIGIGGIAAVWATTRLISGTRAGFFAALALATCAPWFGSMFNHTKDIPFAAAVIGAIYFLVRTSRMLPRPHLHDMLGFGLLLGTALGLRTIGLLVLTLVPVAVLLRAPWHASNNALARFTLRSLTAFVPAFILAYLIMILAWPWAARDVLNPVRALFTFAHFHYPIRTMLSGEAYEMGEVPRWYVPTYLAIKLPLTVLFGALLGFVMAVARARPCADLHAAIRSRETLLIAFAAIFPVLCQVIVQGPAFTGLRHFLFVVPPIAVLAGIGFDGALSWLEARRRDFATAAFACISVWYAWNAGVLIRLHPYEYMFYNPIVGGLEGALRRYEADYWVNIMNEAVDGLEDYVVRAGLDPKKTYSVAVCGERLPFEKEAHAPLRFADNWDTADFFIAPTQMNCDRAMYGRTVVAIERLGVVIGVVKDMRGISSEARWPPIEVARKPPPPVRTKDKL